MRVVALAGGTGSAKLLRGLYGAGVDLTVVVNVGDNIWMYGVYVCPDIDIACYTLAGVADRTRGWGIAGDTFEAVGSLRKYGAAAWFMLGDRDLATSLRRTEMIRSGATLTEVTESLRRALGLKCRVLPVTDDEVATMVATPAGGLHLQEFWVREKGFPEVTRVWYKGARSAKVTPEVASSIEVADRVVICPANPITSVGAMLAVPGFTRLLSDSRARVVALSPMVGKQPYSGPAGKLMEASGFRQDSVGVAQLYSKFLDAMIIASSDSGLRRKVERLGIGCSVSNTLMGGPEDESRLARELLEA
jgi:LPPG:FO 2-phospho-L-lactate transferase